MTTPTVLAFFASKTPTGMVIEIIIYIVVFTILFAPRWWYPKLITFLDRHHIINANRIEGPDSDWIKPEDKKGIERYIRTWLWFEQHTSQEEIEMMTLHMTCMGYECQNFIYIRDSKDGRITPHKLKNGNIVRKDHTPESYMREYYGEEGVEKWKILLNSPGWYQSDIMKSRWIDILPSKEVYDELVNTVRNAPYSRRFRHCG